MGQAQQRADASTDQREEVSGDDLPENELVIQDLANDS
jgi:hypothetical protein